MELTGPAGEYGQAGAKSVEMAFRDINDAGGVATAASSSPTRATAEPGQRRGRRGDAARPGQEGAGDHRRHHLLGVDPDPDLGDRAGRASCRSRRPPPRRRSPSSAARARPTASSSAPSPPTRCRARRRPNMRSTRASRSSPIIHVNNDFGVNMVREFTKAYKALGGTIVSDDALQREAVELSGRGDARRWPASPDGALSRQLSGRRRHHRARLDLRRRAGRNSCSMTA